MIFRGKNNEDYHPDKVPWKKKFAFFSRDLGKDKNGRPVSVWLQSYEIRYVFEEGKGARWEGRLPGDDHIFTAPVYSD